MVSMYICRICEAIDVGRVEGQRICLTCALYQFQVLMEDKLFVSEAEDMLAAAKIMESEERPGDDYTWDLIELAQDSVGAWPPGTEFTAAAAGTTQLCARCFNAHVGAGSNWCVPCQRDFHTDVEELNKELSGPDVSSPKCECGSEALGSPQHSSWCPKFE